MISLTQLLQISIKRQGNVADRIYTIYIATNVTTNVSYVGFDSNWPSRKRQHLLTLLEDKAKDSQYDSKFHRAIRKYGKDSFNWNILYQAKGNKEIGNQVLNIDEPFFIAQYDTYCNGYNMTLGGMGGLGSKRDKTFKCNHSKLAKEKGWKPIYDQTTEDRINRLSKISKSITALWEHRRETGTACGIFCWITNGIENKKIRVDDQIPVDWRKGRTMIKHIQTGKFETRNNK